ncbi:MAG: valine--tRNA ligase, partial [Ramlibacter sp.]|nr:valine--tRNA ligase [Ramlibacter sp.]
MLDKTFDPTTAEPRLYAAWEASGAFAPVDDPAAEPFSIVIPPPNVTGSLHLGHALNNTLQDVLIRFERMRGKAALWLPGTDHAGIATQMVVERQLAAAGNVGRREMGREAFVAKVWEWKAESGGTIVGQLRRLGASCDWSRERFTLDEGLSAAVRKVFVQLHKEGLIYRDKRLVNWDPHFQTAISDLEVEAREVDGHFWNLAYPLADGSGEIVVATTRPETMLGDVALMVHPEDERYRNLIGKMAMLPLVGRQIPIIADNYVDKEFGTGVVKVTPAHDQNDYAVGQRHKLPLVTILDLDATISKAPLLSMPVGTKFYMPDGRLWSQGGDDKYESHDEHGSLHNWVGENIRELMPEKYRGMDRFVARKAIVADLEAIGALVEVKKHKLMVPICTRTGQVIEPMLTDQWFVAMSKVSDQDPTGKSIAQKAIDAVASGEVTFVPENWVNTYNQWMNNIQDWCISRQLWWGHQIPAWYDEDGNVIVARDEAEAQAKAPGKTLRRDEDVLDTWYSSALVPFSTMGWPNQGDSATDDYNLYLPSSVLVTGYDIIFFWVARMMMMGIHFMGEVPFHTVHIHGLVR